MSVQIAPLLANDQIGRKLVPSGHRMFPSIDGRRIVKVKFERVK